MSVKYLCHQLYRPVAIATVFIIILGSVWSRISGISVECQLSNNWYTCQSRLYVMRPSFMSWEHTCMIGFFKITSGFIYFSVHRTKEVLISIQNEYTDHSATSHQGRWPGHSASHQTCSISTSQRVFFRKSISTQQQRNSTTRWFICQKPSIGSKENS